MNRGLFLRMVFFLLLWSIATPCRACNQSPVGFMVTDPEVAHETHRPFVETWVGFSIEFDASDSSDADGYIAKYEWDWDDNGIYDYAESPGDGIATYAFQQAGVYRVRLKVTDDGNAYDSSKYCDVYVWDPDDNEVKYFVSSEEGNNSNNGKSLVWEGVNGPLATIQAALDKIGDGTIADMPTMGHIVVAEGRYLESFAIENKNIILTSVDPDDWDVVEATILDADTPFGPTDSVIEYAETVDKRCELRGLTITGGTGTYYPSTGYVYGGGIFANHSTPTISRCIIRNNTAERGGGLAGCGGIIEYCLVKENTAEDSGNGLGGGLFSCLYGRITNCAIVDNDTDQGGGGLDSCSWSTIVNCTIANNEGYGIYACDNGNTITNCIIWGNDSGSLYDCAHPTYSCIEGYSEDNYHGMISYWACDQGSGYTVADAFNPSHDGTLFGQTYWEEIGNGFDDTGSALHFDGLSDRVKVPGSSVFNPGDEVSVSHWFKTDIRQISNKRMVLCGGLIDTYMTFISNNSGKLSFFVRAAGEDYFASHSVNTYLGWADGSWHHITGTFNKGLGKGAVKVYIDGALCGTAYAPRQGIEEGAGEIYIGGGRERNDDFAGILDEVAIYDRALSPGEVKTFFQDKSYALETNIAATPKFIDSDNVNVSQRDYHLENDSPCIDGGDVTYAYGQEPLGGGRINMGAYGNTPEAAPVDQNGDIIPDAWKLLYWPEDDPSEHGSHDDPDEDGITNLVEYRIGWDPTQDDTAIISGYVTNSETGDVYPSIQHALDWAEDDEAHQVELVLSASRYIQSIDFSHRNISLVSSDPTDPAVVSATILDGNGQDVLTYVGSQADHCVVRGVTITGGARGIYCESASPTIRDCIVRNNRQGGLYCCNNSCPEVRNCYFYRNRNSNDGGAVYNDNSSPMIRNCVLAGNRAKNGGGIYNIASSPIVRQCTIYGNTATHGLGGAVYNDSNSCPEFTNSILWGNRASVSGGEVYNFHISSVPQFDYCCVEGRINGAKCDGYVSTDALTNTCENPLFVDRYNVAGPDKLLGTPDDGLHLQQKSVCVDAAKPVGSLPTDITGRARIDIPGSLHQVSDVDKGAYESDLVWYVKSDATGAGTGISWIDAFTDIQQALAQPEGTEIWVAAGIYEPGTARSDTFILKNGSNEPVQLYGGFRGNEGARYHRDEKNTMTILHGAEISYHVVIGVSSAVLDGFVIQGGRADGAGVDGCGGGMVNNGTATTIRNCQFRDNYAFQGGGMWNQNSDAVVSNCRFESNEAVDSGGGIYTNSGSPSITSCVFAENISSGNGGGSYNEGIASTFARCAFYHNTADNGAGIYNRSSEPEIVSCVFYGNQANQGGGGVSNVNESDATIINCTFTQNEASQGGALFNDASSPSVINAILWKDSATESEFGGEIYNQNEAMPEYSFCAIQSCGGSEIGVWNSAFGFDGGFNIDRDPRFEDATNPIGDDGIWGTRDDGLHLRCYNLNPNRKADQNFRSCLDSANGDMAPLLDMTGRRRNDIGYIVDFGLGRVSYADIGAYESPTIWYVNKKAQGKGTGTCWEDALWDVQDALKDAGDFNYAMDPNTLDPNSFYSEEIWVAEGTYVPCYVGKNFACEIEQRVSFQMKIGVDLFGGFSGEEYSLNQRDWDAHETILSGDLLGDGSTGNSYHIIQSADNVTIDGFTITGGTCEYGGEGGGGICHRGGELLVRNCVFRENEGDSYGGAISAMDGILRIRNCVFSDNQVTSESKGGGIFCRGVVEIVDSEFTGNSASGVGGGIYFAGSLLRADHCSWVQNTTHSYFGGGGIHNQGERMQLYGCVFRQNSVTDMSDATAGDGGAICNVNSCDVTISNCLFEQNRILQLGGVDIAGHGGVDVMKALLDQMEKQL